jgi:succinate dehydrogenase / fumarate reductase membrane anchor subunit
MVKSVLGVNHQGLRDWAAQRVSAIIMAIYTVGMVLFLVCHREGLTFAEWHNLFSQEWVKIATLLTLASVLFHAWLGMWTIFTDYVKCYIVRAVLHLFVILLLFASFLWGMLILWSL